MNDVLLVGTLEFLPDLREDGQRFFHGQRLGRLTPKAIAERPVHCVLRDHVWQTIMDASINDGQTIGVFELFEKLSFLKKLLSLLWGPQVGMQELDGDDALPENDMLGLVYTAECTTVDFGNDTIVTDLFPNEAVFVRHHATPRKVYVYVRPQGMVQVDSSIGFSGNFSK